MQWIVGKAQSQQAKSGKQKKIKSCGLDPAAESEASRSRKRSFTYWSEWSEVQSYLNSLLSMHALHYGALQLSAVKFNEFLCSAVHFWAVQCGQQIDFGFFLNYFICLACLWRTFVWYVYCVYLYDLFMVFFLAYLWSVFILSGLFFVCISGWFVVCIVFACLWCVFVLPVYVVYLYGLSMVCKFDMLVVCIWLAFLWHVFLWPVCGVNLIDLFMVCIGIACLWFLFVWPVYGLYLSDFFKMCIFLACLWCVLV